MRQGTTPTHTFKLPFNTSAIDEARIIYSQGDNVIIKKETMDCTLEDNTISVNLTQEDTFKFDTKKMVDIQVRILSAGGQALASNIIRVSAERCLDSEVLK